MFVLQYVSARVGRGRKAGLHGLRFAGSAILVCALLLGTGGALAQNVVTQHYDNARTGLNPNESILTTANVNTNSFGKLFSQSVDGEIYAQPLYMAGITIPGRGTHNVVFVATENDSVYAFDADNNGGPNASPLWKISLLDGAYGASSGATTVPFGDVSIDDIKPVIGITSTPVIDPSTNTMYLVGKTKENGVYNQRLHALDITSGAEKFGGPVPLSGSVPGNGNGSMGGTLNFDVKWENNRAGLLLLNGIVYIAFGSHGDNGPWHGWILAYNAATLQQTSVWCSSPNGIGAGIWMGGSGIAADTSNPTGSSPGGRLFVATGNGTFDASTPYTNHMDYGDSIVRLHLNNGVMTVADDFTPLNQSMLNSTDRDVASGGVLLLPDQSTGGHTHLLVQSGKEGRISVVDRDNMGGFNTGSDNIVQEMPVNNSGQTNQNFPMGGLWGMAGYGNNTVYFWGVTDNMKSFPLSSGKLSSTPSHTATQRAGFPSPTPVISSNGNSNPIVWTLQTDAFNSNGSAYLRAHDATNITNTLYNSLTNSARDTPGGAVKFVVPVVTNGKVYVGTSNSLAVFGLLNGAQQTAAPSISPSGQMFTGTLPVTITDSTPGASIFYSTTGTATTSSTPYTGQITVGTTETVSAIASAPGFLQSLPTSETYTLQTQTVMPSFSPIPSAYGSAQTVTISDASPTPTIYYAINAPATTSSTPFSGIATVTVGQSETINAIATSPGLSTSPQASATYSIGAGTGASFLSGFSSAASVMTFNGSTALNDTRLQLTNGLANEAGSAWFNTPMNVQNFTNDFTFQLSNAQADGITFTIQNTGVTALGPTGGGLGYGPDTPGGTGGIPKSVAIKFDLYDNDGEGADSTGLYTNGASPTVPATDMTGKVDLHSGDTFSVHMVYNGTTLTMTLTDGVTNASFTTSWTVNIPSIVGGNTAFVGFTGGTGGLTASQKIETWNFVSGGTAPQVATPPIFSPAAGTYTGTQPVTITDTTPGSTIFYTLDKSTPGTTAGGSTFQYSTAVSVASSETITALATAPGYTTSATSSAAYVINNTLPAAPTPIITPGTGTYTSAQTVSISDPGATIFYTTNGTPPTTASTQYNAPFVVNATSTVQAIATETGFSTSATAQSVITINTGSTGGGSTSAVNFGSGFSGAGLQFNGHTKLNGTRLQLSDTTATYEVASAFWTTPVNMQTFTNDFNFQLTNPNADGFTFTIQNAGITAIGPVGGGLGYGPDAPGGTPGIAKSVAIKFDLYSNAGEGTNSTGLYVNGASPTTPATTLGGGVNLHSGDIMKAHMTYDGTTLTLTITDTVNPAQTFTTSWPINIPSTVGGNTALVGFTAGTGGLTAQQEIITWTYSTTSGTTTPPKTPVVYQTANLPSASSGPAFRQFTYASFPDTTGTILDATAVGNNVTLTVNVATAGIADVKVSVKELNTRGIWQLSINGTNVGSPQDEYQNTGSGAYAVFDLGNFNFAAAGNYAFKFTVTGKNAASSGYSIAFDDITLTPQ
jgi:Legume lectin domain/Chitobiase/beta-hexosaminidase C-terminal domain